MENFEFRKIDSKLKKRVFSFIWRAGAYVVLATASYLANISDIREIELSKIATIFTITISAYVASEITKALRR